jgi:uncharacterized lipoprotein YajG
MKSLLAAACAALVLAACAAPSDTATSSTDSQATRCKEEPTVGSNIGRRCKN